MLNHKEMLIISNLRKDARMSLTEMSRSTHIPVSTIYENMKHFEDALIKKYTCLVDFSKLGYSVRANVMLRVDRECREAAAEYLMKSLSVNSLYKINSGFDFMLEAVFRDMKELDNFLELLEQKFKLKSKEVHFIIDDIKKEEFVAEPELMDILCG